MLQNKYEQEKTQNWNLVQKVFDQSYFNILDSIAPRDSTTQYFGINNEKIKQFLQADFRLYTYDKSVLQELRNWAFNSTRNYKVIVRDIYIARQKAESAVAALQKEYHLK